MKPADPANGASAPGRDALGPDHGVSAPDRDAPHAPDRDASAPARVRRSRPHSVADTIKDWIQDRGLSPGDRLPQEAQLIAELGVSKGTVREALKVLETQGLVRTRTGPGGGAFITAVGEELAGALLGNHFFFDEVGIADVYALRIALEPRLARALAPHVTDAQIEHLRASMSAYREPPASIDEARRQREAELDFHATLASFSDNPLLRFTCRFLTRLLADLAVCKRIYEQPNPALRESGVAYQERLIEALTARDGEAAHAILEAHMRAAEALMLEQEAELTRRFLSGG